MGEPAFEGWYRPAAGMHLAGAHGGTIEPKSNDSHSVVVVHLFISGNDPHAWQQSMLSALVCGVRAC